MALFDPGQALLGLEIIWVEVQYIFEAGANFFGIFDQAREPEPSLLVAIIGLDDLGEQRAASSRRPVSAALMPCSSRVSVMVRFLHCV